MVGVADDYAGLIEEVRQVNRHNPAPVAAPNPVVAKVSDIGRGAVGATEDITVFLQMLGSLFLALFNVLRRPRSLRLTSLVYQLYKVGWQAIPIMVLITLPDRRHHCAARHLSFPQVRRRSPMSSTWSGTWCCANSAS